ncbi:MAG TPA: class I SAM-dependent methyltransferase [Gemmatimonadales bacterium]|nr:class I SAM-dependent methyltransferase [Gemmatimonadales bacterium]
MPPLANAATPPADNSLQPRLDAFLARLPVGVIVSRVQATSSFGREAIASTLKTFINETHATLAVVESRIDRNQRVLEVGAGICLFSAFLKSEGYDIVALEPAIGGYEMFAACKNAILEHFAALNLRVLEIPAGELDPAKHGTFDLIFSNNVIEHIPDLPEALGAMMSVLRPGGQMVHTTANYWFPYEPHYGIPVLVWSPGLTRRVFASRIGQNPGIWDSLNFLTYGDIQRFAKQHGYRVTFDPELLYGALLRLDSDPVFRARHDNGFAALLFRTLKATGIVRLLKYLPPSWTSPMRFAMTRD